MTNKLESYDRATKELVLLATDYELPIIGKYSLPEIVYALRESFKNPLTHKKVFGEFQDESFDPATGFCGPAHYYIYSKFPGLWEFKTGVTHWWLEHKIISGPFDITYTQFIKPFLYQKGQAEKMIGNNSNFENKLFQQAMILGRAAGLE